MNNELLNPSIFLGITDIYDGVIMGLDSYNVVYRKETVDCKFTVLVYKKYDVPCPAIIFTSIMQAYEYVVRHLEEAKGDDE